jgi:hypothetical protein
MPTCNAPSASRTRRHAPQIHVGGKAPVQPHLLLAYVATERLSAEIEEIEPDRLLQLVGALVSKEHVGHMRLDHCHGRSTLRIR